MTKEMNSSSKKCISCIVHVFIMFVAVPEEVAALVNMKRAVKVFVQLKVFIHVR